MIIYIGQGGAIPVSNFTLFAIYMQRHRLDRFSFQAKFDIILSFLISVINFDLKSKSIESKLLYKVTEKMEYIKLHFYSKQTNVTPYPHNK